MDDYNPIRTVDGELCKCPSSYKWKEEDLSNKDAGRTEDTIMHKNRIGQIVRLELSWNGLTIAEGAAVLNLFDPEYVTVCYLDAKAGRYITSEFYVGDRSGALYNAEIGRWSTISFNLIERSGV